MIFYMTLYTILHMILHTTLYKTPYMIVGRAARLVKQLRSPFVTGKCKFHGEPL